MTATIAEVIETLKRLIEATLNPVAPIRMEPDGGGFYWSKERNALNHYANPHALTTLLDHIATLTAEVERIPDLQAELGAAVSLWNKAEAMCSLFEAANRRQTETVIDLRAEIATLTQRAEDAEHFIAQRGYRRCDIPACNCPWWHGGHAEERLREIYEALGERTNGATALTAIATLTSDLATARGELAKRNSK